MSLPRAVFWSVLGLLVVLWLASLGIAVGGAHGAGAVRGSGHLITQTRELAPFHSIAGRGTVDLDVTAGGPQHVEVVADDNVVPKIRTTVANGELVVDTQDSIWTAHPLKVRVVVPALDSLKVSGSGDATVRGLEGAGIVLSSEGSGDITASGSVDKLTYTGDGSGDAALQKLDARDAIVRVHGSGDAHVNASDTLDIEIFGSGDVRYRGSPRLTSNVKGSGDVSQE
jgi:hypothetical protein